MRAGCARHGRPGPSVPPCFRHLAMKKNNVHKAPRRRLSWNDPAVRSLAYQAVLVGIIGFVVWYLVSNTLHNLAVRNISTGFAFLGREAGFAIGESRSAEPTSELQSLMRISYAGFFLTKKK